VGAINDAAIADTLYGSAARAGDVAPAAPAGPSAQAPFERTTEQS
jgi:hypothetical protein